MASAKPTQCCVVVVFAFSFRPQFIRPFNSSSCQGLDGLGTNYFVVVVVFFLGWGGEDVRKLTRFIQGASLTFKVVKSHARIKRQIHILILSLNLSHSFIL